MLTRRRRAALATTAMTGASRPAGNEIAVVIIARNRERSIVSAACTNSMPTSRCSVANTTMHFGHRNGGNALLAQHSIDFRGLIV